MAAVQAVWPYSPAQSPFRLPAIAGRRQRPDACCGWRPAISARPAASSSRPAGEDTIMTTSHPTSIEAVVAQHLCTGCGACAGMAPSAVPHGGPCRRPAAGPSGLRGASRPAGERVALAVCPGAGAGPKPAPAPATAAGDAPCVKEWGSVLEIWEGHAADPDMRWRGSSGGAVTALAAFALESGEAEGVVHVRQSGTDALLNEFDDQPQHAANSLAAAGSRYAPASPCDRLGDIAASAGPLVFIGKPCDVQAAAAAAKREPRIARNIALTISIFCAGAPSTNGTRALLEALGVPAGRKGHRHPLSRRRLAGRNGRDLSHARRRRATTRGISYEEGWGDILQKHRQWRCHLCADHTGEFADISVGDPWDKPRDGGDRAGLLAHRRAQRARPRLPAARHCGGHARRRAPPARRARRCPAQPGAHPAHPVRPARWACASSGLPPRAIAAGSSASLWLDRTSLRDKLGSVLGTVRRAFRRRLWVAEAGARERRDDERHLG